MHNSIIYAYYLLRSSYMFLCVTRCIQGVNTIIYLKRTSIKQVTMITLLWPLLLMCVVRRFWCQLPDDGKIITPKRVGGT